VSAHLDKLVTELLELSKLPHLALGFTHRSEIGQSLRDGFALGLIGKS
jgi:hypothetical protein